MLKRLLAAAAALAVSGAARAEVIDASPAGFEVRQIVVIDAPAAKVWAALIQPGQWWSSAHTYSGDAHNLTLEAKAGGCWCEALPGGGGVQHMRVVYVDPGKGLRAYGGLGPFQFTGAAGHLQWTLAEKDGKTTLTQTYDIGGYVKGGIQALAAPVDHVMTEQIGRLKALVETGKAG